MYQYPNHLMRYGVLGMKWGRRRERRASIILYATAKYTGADKVVAAYAKQTVSSVIDSEKKIKGF